MGFFGGKMNIIQLDLLANSEEMQTQLELSELKKEINNLRRGLFARYHELEGRLMKLEQPKANEHVSDIHIRGLDGK